jgi:hypothetical protein
MSGAPLPQERPYDLGQNDGRYASNYSSQAAEPDSRQLASAALARHRADPRFDSRLANVSPDTEMPAYMAARSRAPRVARVEEDTEPRPALRPALPQGFAGGPAPQQAAVSPMTAYAPVSDVSRAISTGRGLY